VPQSLAWYTRDRKKTKQSKTSNSALADHAPKKIRQDEPEKPALPD